MDGYREFDMPCGVEVAAHRFAAACRRDGFDGFASVTVSGGAVSHIAIEAGGETRTFFLMKGGWHELVEVPE